MNILSLLLTRSGGNIIPVKKMQLKVSHRKVNQKNLVFVRIGVQNIVLPIIRIERKYDMKTADILVQLFNSIMHYIEKKDDNNL